MSPWLKVNGKLRDYHLALISHLGGALHLLSLDRNYSKSRNLFSTRKVKRQHLHFIGLCRNGRMDMNIGMSTALGTSVRFVPLCPWVKVSLVEETTKCHQKVKHWDNTTDRTSWGPGKAPRQHGSFPEMEMPELTSGKKEKKDTEITQNGTELQSSWSVSESRQESIFLLSRLPKGKSKYNQTRAFYNSGGHTQMVCYVLQGSSPMPTACV